MTSIRHPEFISGSGMRRAFSGFALSYGGGQNFLVSKANLEIRVEADRSAFIL